MYKISNLLWSIISNFLFGYVVFLVKYLVCRQQPMIFPRPFLLSTLLRQPFRRSAALSDHQIKSKPKIKYFTRKTTYSNRKLPYRTLINTFLLILIFSKSINVVFDIGQLTPYVKILIVATLVEYFGFLFNIVRFCLIIWVFV